MSDGIKQWPPHKYALEKLGEMGKISYGEIIEWETIEGLIDRGDRTGWAFRGEYMSMTDCLKEMGYMVTERGMNETGIRILTREEMADVVKNKELRKCNDSLRNSLMLAKVPRHELPEEEVKKLDHWETKVAVVGATSKVLLRRRNLPSPEMAVKSIKDVCK